jgi:hypothetical protein
MGNGEWGIVRLGLASAMVLTAAPLRAADDAGRVEWRTGLDVDQQLAQRVSVELSHAPLRPRVDNLARLHRVSLLLDRREDPSRPIEFAAKDLPLEQVYRDLAAKLGMGFCRLGPVGYFGPNEVCEKLRTLAALRREDVARLPAAVRGHWTKSAAWQWDDLATPRELLEQLASQGHARLAGLDQVPHDLWAAAQLAPLPLVDRLTLVAAEFDLTFKFDDDGQTVTLVPWPDKVVIERQYAGGSRTKELAERWDRVAPSADVKIVGTKLVVRARVEDHELFAASREPRKEKPKAEGVQVYTLNLEAVPLDKLLATLERKLDIKIRIDQAAIDKAGIKLGQSVSVKVEQATLDQLLKAVLAPAKLAFRHEGKGIVVEPTK